VSGPKNALAAWGSSALQYVELPSGTKMLVKLPNVALLVSTGQFPQELRKIASKYVSSGIELKELDDEGVGEFLGLTYNLIGRAIRYIALPDSPAEKPGDEGWEPVTLTGPEVREMDVSQDDLDTLSNLVHRKTSTQMATYASRMERGLLDEQAAKMALRDLAEGGGDTLEQMAGFRGQPGGAERGDDGSAVGVKAERPARAQRSRCGAGGRRGGGA